MVKEGGDEGQRWSSSEGEAWGVDVLATSGKGGVGVPRKEQLGQQSSVAQGDWLRALACKHHLSNGLGTGLSTQVVPAGLSGPWTTDTKCVGATGRSGRPGLSFLSGPHRRWGCRGKGNAESPVCTSSKGRLVAGLSGLTRAKRFCQPPRDGCQYARTAARGGFGERRYMYSTQNWQAYNDQQIQVLARQLG